MNHHHELIRTFHQLLNTFDNIQTQIVTEIDGLETAYMKSMHIVFNKGKVGEGVPKKNVLRKIEY